MSGDRDKFLMRAKDWMLLIGSVIGLMVGLGKVFILANSTENNAARLAKLEPIVSSHETKFAVEDERWSQVQITLAQINRKIDKRNRQDD